MAFLIPGFKSAEKLYENSRTLIYRAIRLKIDEKVILKICKSDVPETERSLLRREFAIISKLNLPGVVKAITLEEYNGGLIMQMVDIGGKSLDRFQLPLSTEQFLEISIALADTIGLIHQHHIIHKNINPSNIVWNSNLKQLNIIDLGIADEIPERTITPQAPSSLEGTLEYISPEQTGRMNRIVDYRSDFYSLGVTFYQLLTGKLPFVAPDALGMIHLHIAAIPTTPHELNPVVPEIISRIVLKLMAKMADERYQSARGLSADLDRCMKDLQSEGSVKIFDLGREDFVDKLRVPQKLYGRERETEQLLEAFEQVSKGGRELLLVAGYAGIGKTALVHEVHRPITEKKGYFIEGKFDLLQRNVPYYAWIQAFAGFVDYLLMESEAEVAHWRASILNAVGSIGKVVMDVIPNLELIIGSQPDIPALGPAETQNRFNYVFLGFIKSIATKEHPLVVFLDDMQWIDAASLNLLQNLMSTVVISNVLIIGAYRDNEVDALHPLTKSIESLRQEQAPARLLTLGDLSEETVNGMIADTLHVEHSQAVPLTQLIYAKTGGNSFFMLQTLGSLVERGLISYDAGSKRWEWDIWSLRSMEISDNVVTLMLGKIRELSSETQHVLTLAACIGFRFTLGNVSIIGGQTKDITEEVLQPALREGLLIPLDGTYQFVHDRVQEAAYALVPETRRKSLHLRIGRLLLAQYSQGALAEHIFEIVAQFNHSIDLVTDIEEKATLRRLNTAAGRKARGSVAYESGQRYFKQAIALLPPDPWNEYYEETLAVYRELGECEYLIGNFLRADELLTAAIEKARFLLDLAGIYRLHLRLYQISGRYHEALDAAFMALRRFGITFPATDENARAMAKVENRLVSDNLGTKSIADLCDIPLSDDEETRALIGLLADTVPIIFLVRQGMFPLFIAKAVNICLQRGHGDESAALYNSYAMALAADIGNIGTALQFAEMAIKLSEKTPGAGPIRGRILFSYSVTNKIWRDHFAMTLPVMERAFLTCLDFGDLVYAAYTLMHAPWVEIESGKTLKGVTLAAQRYVAFLKDNHNDIAYHLVRLQQQFAMALQGKTRSVMEFSDAAFDEASTVAAIEQAGLRLGNAFYNIMKQMAAFIDERYDEALRWAGKAAPLLIYVSACANEATHYFYYALTLTVLHDQAPADQQQQFTQSIKKIHAKLKVWADNCPENFANRYFLISAEIARTEGRDLEAMRLYDQAIRSARDNNFIHQEAIATEVASRFYRARGFDWITDAYLRKAHADYTRWGAHGKVRQLERLYPWIAQPQKPAGEKLMAHLDLSTVMKATHAISSEIEMDRLLGKIMHIVIENAGAQYGYLLIEKNGIWTVVAKGGGNQEEIEMTPPVNIDESDLVSPGVVRFVARTGKNVVLDNAGLQGEFVNDSHVRNKKNKSLLCAPLLHRGKMISILYLENNLTTNAFTPERVQFLEMLLSQVVISLEIATIYESLKESETKYRRLIDTANEGVWVLGPDTLTVSVNARMAAMLGVKQEEMIGKPVTSFMLQEDRQDHLTRMEKRRKGIAEQFECRFIRKNGHTLWTIVSAMPIFDKDHNFLGSFGMHTDITERKMAEQNLALMNSALDKVKDAAFLIDESSHFMYVNHEACRLLGYSRDELLGMSALNIDPDFSMERWHEHWQDLKMRGSIRLESHHKDKDGHIFPVEISANYIEYNGKPYNMVLARDITERKRTEEELHRYRAHLEELVDKRTKELSDSNAQLQIAKEQAESANKSKSIFLSNMSHELRTPLNSILGFVSLTKELPDVTPEQRKNLDIITLSGGHLLNLINNVLDISKIESGRMVLEVVPIDLHQLLQEMRSLLYVNAEERGLNFEVEQAPELPRQIEVDGGKLRQVLINLIGNAIKYTKQGGVILRTTVTKREPAEQVRLRFEVEDTGPGVSDEDRKRIFQPFVQLKGRAVTETGTGLGLAICRQYVDLMGGHIDVISEKGKGSLFFFEIPVKELLLEEKAITPELGRVIGIEKGQPRYRILIAEDQLENRILLHKTLEPFSFDIREAANGQEAVEIFERWHPDLIWMDIRMPVMDGLEATHRIKSTDAGSQTKIIAITAQALEEDRIKIMHAGCDDFIRKPYRNREIFDALSRHLGLRFVYEEKPVAPSKKPELELIPEQLAKVPSELIKKLHLAVIGLDPEPIQELTNEIAYYDQAVGGALQRLANRFDYDRLLQILDEYAKKT